MTLPGELDIYKRLSFQSPYGGLSPRIQQSDIPLWQGQPSAPQQQTPWWQRVLEAYGQMQAPLWGAMGKAWEAAQPALYWAQEPFRQWGMMSTRGLGIAGTTPEEKELFSRRVQGAFESAEQYRERMEREGLEPAGRQLKIPSMAGLRQAPSQIASWLGEQLPGAPGTVRQEYEALPWHAKLLAELPAYYGATTAVGAIPIKGVPISTWEAKGIGALARRINLARFNKAFKASPEYKQLIKEMPKSSMARNTLEQRLRTAFLYDMQKHPETANQIRQQIWDFYPRLTPIGKRLPATTPLLAPIGGGEALMPMSSGKWAALTVAERMNLVRALGLSGHIASKAWEALAVADRAILAEGAPVAPAARELEMAPEAQAKVDAFYREATERFGQPKGTIEPPAITPQMAQRQIDTEFLNPIRESPLDMAATTYMATGDINQYVASMPVYETLSIGEAQARGIALRTTKGGKLVPSMRQSGFYVTEEFANYKNFRDVSSPSGQAQDPTRLLQNIQSGFEAGPLTKYVLWPTHRTALAAYDFSDTQKFTHHQALQDFGLAGKPKLQRAAGWVIEHISQAEADIPVGDLLAKPEIANLISRYPIETQGAIVRYAQWARKFFDKALDMQNQTRIKRGQEAIPYRENYLPWVIEENVWSKTFGIRTKPKEVKNQPELPDYIMPTKPFNPRALAREGGMAGYLKEKSLTKLVDDYIETAMKDIFYTNIIHNAKIHAAQLRSMGYPSSADLIERWATESYGGVRHPIDRAIRRVVPNKAIAAALTLRRRLQSAVFPLNWTWNAFIQTSSIALTVARYGPTNTMKGLSYLFSKNAKDYVRKNAYSWIIKRRMGGTISQQDLAQSLEKVYALEASKIERAEHAANFLTHTIEEKLTGISCMAAYYDGLAKGYKGRELIEHVSEGGAKTQSMYNREDLPGVLRAKMVGAMVPFQTFAFEVFNTVRELAGRAGAYQSTTEVAAGEGAKRSRRIKLILEWIASILAIQIVVDKYINRKPWVSSAFLPFFAVAMGGANVGNPWNQILPVRYTQELITGISAAAKYGNFRKLRKWALRYHAMAGVQMERTIQGIEAVNSGRVTDISGKTLFRVKPNEWIKAITMGVYATEEGREYIDKMQEAKGPSYEWTGIPEFWRKPKKPKKPISPGGYAPPRETYPPLREGYKLR